MFVNIYALHYLNIYQTFYFSILHISTPSVVLDEMTEGVDLSKLQPCSDPAKTEIERADGNWTFAGVRETRVLKILPPGVEYNGITIRKLRGVLANITREVCFFLII